MNTHRVVIHAGTVFLAGLTQMLSDGSVRLQTVMQSAQGPSRFTYHFAGAVPVVQNDESIALVQTIETTGLVAEATVGKIGPAWAVDANGRPVATHYEIKGNGILVQVIETNKTTKYPVVADPTVGFTWQGINVYFNKSETAFLASEKVSIITLIASFIPPTMIPGTIVAVAGIAAGQARDKGMCLKYTYPLVLWALSSYSGGNCR